MAEALREYKQSAASGGTTSLGDLLKEQMTGDAEDGEAPVEAPVEAAEAASAQESTEATEAAESEAPADAEEAPEDSEKA